MTSRLYKEGHLNATAAPVVCPECGRLSSQPHCKKCGKHHDRLWWHKDLGQCSAKVDGLYYCPNDALKDKRGKSMLFCYDHSIEKRIADNEKAERKNQSPAFIEASGELAAELGQPESLEKPVPFHAHHPSAERRFMVRSSSRPTQEHLVELLADRLMCSCEAGRTNHKCRHKEAVEAAIFAGLREVAL